MVLPVNEQNKERERETGDTGIFDDSIQNLKCLYRMKL